MTQRLGVAAALLGQPRVLILDEPTNGLDPASIVAMRSLIASAREQGWAVLLSSHLLSEVDPAAAVPVFGTTQLAILGAVLGAGDSSRCG